MHNPSACRMRNNTPSGRYLPHHVNKVESGKRSVSMLAHVIMVDTTVRRNVSRHVDGPRHAGNTAGGRAVVGSRVPPAECASIRQDGFKVRPGNFGVVGRKNAVIRGLEIV